MKQAEAAAALLKEKERQAHLERLNKERAEKHEAEMNQYYLEIQILKKKIRQEDDRSMKRIQEAKDREQKAAQEIDKIQTLPDILLQVGVVL